MEGKRLKGLSADRDKAAIRHTPLAKSIRGVISANRAMGNKASRGRQELVEVARVGK
jgi:hypothetical protein